MQPRLSTRFSFVIAAAALGCARGACGLSRATRTETAASCADAAGCSVPFEIIDNRIFVPLWLNGQGPFHILLDTGAGAVLSTTVAEKLKLPHGSTINTGGVGNATVSGYSSHLKSVAIGNSANGLSVENIDVEVLPFTDSSAVFGTVPVDGYLGFPFYEKYVVEHDYARRILTFRDPRSFIYDGPGVALEVESTGYVPIVNGAIDGSPAKFGIDTGARSALLLYGPYVTSHALREKYQPKFSGVTGWGVGGPVRSDIARIGSITLGEIQGPKSDSHASGPATGIELRDVVARFSLNKGGVTAGSSKAGLVGPDILKQFTLICDYSRKRLILEKNKQFGVGDTYDKAGVWLIQNGDAFKVLDVIAGGPAERAGLRVGDKVIAVDGKAVGTLVLPEVRDQWKYSPAGTKLTLRVQSAAGSREVVVVLQELV